MQDFIDLEGASGASYRFRIWASDAVHLPVAGNYVVVKQDADGFNVGIVGIADDLSKVRADGSKVAVAEGAYVFTRLNVSRAIRTAEHDDIAARYSKARLMGVGKAV
jgi:hypothetical protein